MDIPEHVLCVYFCRLIRTMIWFTHSEICFPGLKLLSPRRVPWGFVSRRRHPHGMRFFTVVNRHWSDPMISGFILLPKSREFIDTNQECSSHTFLSLICEISGSSKAQAGFPSSQSPKFSVLLLNPICYPLVTSQHQTSTLLVEHNSHFEHTHIF